MNWIRKTIFFLSFLIIAFFAFQANEIAVSNVENQKTDPTFSIENVDTSEFIQPQTTYHFGATVKTSYPNIIKWFDSLLMTIPVHHAVRSTSNFANQFLNQSQKIAILLYPFHYFW